MIKKHILNKFTFKSKSHPDKTYETLIYNDGSTSCNCPGWTRRVAIDGSRSCGHTIEVGFAVPLRFNATNGIRCSNKGVGVYTPDPFGIDTKVTTPTLFDPDLIARIKSMYPEIFELYNEWKEIKIGEIKYG